MHLELNACRVCGGRGGGVGGAGSGRSTTPCSAVTAGSGGGGWRAVGGVTEVERSFVRRGGGRGGGVGGGLLDCGEGCVDVSESPVTSSNESLKPLSLRRLLPNALQRLSPVSSTQRVT